MQMQVQLNLGLGRVEVAMNALHRAVASECLGWLAALGLLLLLFQCECRRTSTFKGTKVQCTAQ